MKKVELSLSQILNFFEVEFNEVKNLSGWLSRMGNPNASLILTDPLKLYTVLLLYTRKDWSDYDKFIAISNYLEYGDNKYRFSSLFIYRPKQDRHLKFRENIRSVSIDQLKTQYSGVKYRDLIQTHINTLDCLTLEMAILSSITAFTPEEKKIKPVSGL